MHASRASIQAVGFLALSFTLLALTPGCSGFHEGTKAVAQESPPEVRVKIIAFNDFHGHLKAPGLSILAPAANGTSVAVPAGGAAYLSSAIQSLKLQNPNFVVVSAGDMMGATPLVSALFLDEPTIEVMNEIQIDFNAVGNHEFDKGQDELLRMQTGGCAQHTRREPCQVNLNFPGANFKFLAANVRRADGSTLFPSVGIKEFINGNQRVKVGFIGMTLKDTPSIVTPAGVAGLSFEDEAKTANALIPQLRAQGADAIVVLLHEGGHTESGFNGPGCAGLAGGIVPILEKLDPSIDLVVSGHTHRAYICDYGRINPAKPFLLTSAGQYGSLLTDIDLVIDAKHRKVVSKTATNLIVQGEAFTDSSGKLVPLTQLYPQFNKDPAVETIVSRYAVASAPLENRVVGSLSGSITLSPVASGESPLGNLIADAQLAATRAPDRGAAQIAFMNSGGVRANLIVPADGGPVTYGQIFSAQPFGNSLVVKTFSGLQLKALLEQQFSNSTIVRFVYPSRGFSYAFDLKKAPGQRVSAIQLNGKAIEDGLSYRVTMNSFMATGGNGFTVFQQGTQALGGELDVDALEAYLLARPGISAPATDRIKRL